MGFKSDIKDQIYKNRKFISKQPSDSFFVPAHESKLDQLIENYLYHAFHAKAFVVSDDESNHNIKFKDKVVILQSFIDLKIMGISKVYFEFAVYQTAIEGSLTRAEEAAEGQTSQREIDGARKRLFDHRV